MWNSADIGRAGEDAAAKHLTAHGYRIRERNYANIRGIRLGEIDIVAERKGEIVFVEVKAVFLDSGKESRLPEWQVNRSKLRKMEKAAGAYLKERKIEDRDYSFDVVAVTFRPGKEPEIRHLDHVFFS
ncbi:MAG: YraN family protein [Candidatus Moraniibacteriota bacterium]|nr:MAG: YraN family protein [Candidatus Moranbacteria bacterium]